jgi:hypothetical protein
MKVLPRPFKCIAKLLRRSVENPWVRYRLEKRRQNKMEGGARVYRTFGWSRDFSRVCGEPFKSIRYWRGLFQDP